MGGGNARFALPCGRPWPLAFKKLSFEAQYQFEASWGVPIYFLLNENTTDWGVKK